jgi:hypothetical protein
MKTIEFYQTTHKGRPHIALKFPYDPDTIRKIKTAKGLWWNPARKCWMGKAAYWNLAKLKSQYYQIFQFVDQGVEAEAPQQSAAEKPQPTETLNCDGTGRKTAVKTL